MEQVADVRQFMGDPVGRYWLGRRHLVFCHSPTLLGHAAWGRPDVDDVRELLACCAVGLQPEREPHAWLVDLRGLEYVDLGTFGPFVDYTRRNGPVLAAKIRRQAQLRPEGLVGAIISGFSQVARLPYPERVFDAADEAVAWLGVDAGLGLAVVRELADIREVSLARSGVVADLRGVLERRGALGLKEAALALGVAPRSLQRGLTDAGTTFRNELRAYQVARAKHLLADERRTLTWIAVELGFSSLQHLSTAFRRATGETPSAWRSRVTRAARVA